MHRSTSTVISPLNTTRASGWRADGKDVLKKEYHEAQHKTDADQISFHQFRVWILIHFKQREAGWNCPTALPQGWLLTPCASYTPLDFESHIRVPISSQVWQQQDWRRLGTHFSRHRKCSSDISTTSYTLLLLPAAAIVIPVEAQPCSSPAPKGDVLYGLHTTLVSLQSNRKMKRSPKRKTDLASGRKQWTLPGLAEMPLAAGAVPAQVEGAAPSPACGTLQGAEASACAVQLQPLPASNKPSKQLSTSEHGSVPRNSSGSIQHFKPKTSWHYQVELNHLYSHNHDDPLATSSFLLLALLDSVQRALTQVTAAYGK